MEESGEMAKMDLVTLIFAIFYIFVPALLCTILVGFSQESFIGFIAIFLVTGGALHLFSDSTLNNSFIVTGIFIGAVYFYLALIRGNGS